MLASPPAFVVTPLRAEAHAAIHANYRMAAPQARGRHWVFAVTAPAGGAHCTFHAQTISHRRGGRGTVLHFTVSPHGAWCPGSALATLVSERDNDRSHRSATLVAQHTLVILRP